MERTNHDPAVADDLRVEYEQAQNLNNYPGGWRDGKQVMDLIERIAALTKEVERLKQSLKDSAIREDKWAADCEKAEAENRRLKAPISDEEWPRWKGLDREPRASRAWVDAILASRQSKRQPEEPK